MNNSVDHWYEQDGHAVGRKMVRNELDLRYPFQCRGSSCLGVHEPRLAQFLPIRPESSILRGIPRFMSQAASQNLPHGSGDGHVHVAVFFSPLRSLLGTVALF